MTTLTINIPKVEDAKLSQLIDLVKEMGGDLKVESNEVLLDELRTSLLEAKAMIDGRLPKLTLKEMLETGE